MHGEIVGALAASLDADSEPLSDITSPAPGLLVALAGAVDTQVRGLLLPIAERSRVARLAREELVLRYLRQQRQRVWETNWKVVTPAGPLASVSLLVTDHDPASVTVRVDSRDCAVLRADTAVAAIAALPPGLPLGPKEVPGRLVAVALVAIAGGLGMPPPATLRSLVGVPVRRPRIGEALHAHEAGPRAS